MTYLFYDDGGGQVSGMRVFDNPFYRSLFNANYGDVRGIAKIGRRNPIIVENYYKNV